MATDVLPAIAGLERIILELSNGLRRYVQKEGASDIYIQKQNELILELTNLYNRLSGLKYLETWESLERRIERLELIDPQLTAHTIVLHTKPSKGYNYSFIEINPFRL
ncbi:MAG: hypothetical protein HY951_02685 [Bacteroidia bacterium]|nr:hypothetical protein [Bacteroidia bacterium]